MASHGHIGLSRLVKEITTTTIPMSQNPTSTLPYRRPETNLIISIDLGTAYSGASWVLLDHAQDPFIWDVSEFREDFPFAKVPSVLYYDHKGNLRAAGSDTLDIAIDDVIQQKWTRVEWFKLLLRPDSMAHKLDKAPKTEMPRNKKLVDVIADFFQHIAKLAATHFHETMDIEGKIWQEVKDRVIYILSYTNGWNTFQHPIMREAAIRAGMVPDSEEGKNRIIFVSEGEASLHWCIKRRVIPRDVKIGSQFVLVDAGGGTIDISSFKTIGTVPLKFEESSIPECYLQGSAFATQAFRRFIQDKLNGSSFGDPDTITRMVENFDQQLQCNFRDRQQDLLVRFGRDQDNDPEFDINEGQLLVRGEEMATFYEPVCRAVVDSVKAKVIPNSKTTVVLVGGFAGNRYLFEEVQRRLPGIPVFRPHGAAVTVSANGAICFYLDRSVTARMAKWTYGVSCVHDFNPKNPKHVRRISRVQRNPVTGQRFIDGGFLVTLKKGTLIQETELTRFPFWHSQTERTATTLNIVLECYRGDVPDIQFRDEDSQERFHELCWFKVAIPETSLRRAQKVKRRSALLRSTQYYYVSNFHIVVSFGAMEFKFHIEWRDEQGRTHRGSLTPIWNEFEDHLPSAADSRSRYPDPSARMSYDALSIAHSGQTNFSEQDYSSIWSQSRLSLLSITTLDVEGPVPPLQRDRERLPRLPQLQELSSASTNLSLTLLNEVGPGLTEPSESYDQFVSEGEIRGSDLAPGRPPLAWEGDIEFQFLNSQSVCTPRLIVACDDWAVSASSEVLLFTLSSVGYKATQRLLGSVNYLRE